MFWGCHLKTGESKELSPESADSNILFIASAALAPGSESNFEYSFLLSNPFSRHWQDFRQCHC